MPVVDSVVMPIFPNDSQCIGTHCNNVAKPCRWCIPQFDVEYIRVRLGSHVLMSAAAGGTWTGRAQQLKRIDACVIVAPCDCEFFCLFICCNASRFFVHIQLHPPPCWGREGWGSVTAQEHNSGNPLQPSPRVFRHMVQRDTTTRSHLLRAVHPVR